MSALGQGLFYVSAGLALAGAIGTVASRSAIRAAMALLVTILGVAGLYFTLSAELLAAVQLIVYAGAVVVLFVFVVMVLGVSGAAAGADRRTWLTRTIGALALAAAAVATFVLLARSGIGGPHFFDPARPELGTVWGLGNTLFTQAIVPFEIAGVLLLAAIVGVMAVARTRRAPRQLANPGGNPEPRQELTP